MEMMDLIKKARKGNKEALIQLIMDRKDEYYRLAYSYVGNKEDSLDALQDMIIIVFDNIKKLREPESFYSWSKTILVNLCKTAIRKRNKIILIDSNEEEEYYEDYKREETRHDVFTYLKRLNIHQQEAIKLKYFLDMDYATISRITGTPEGTVKSRVFNALNKLKEMFGGEY